MKKVYCIILSFFFFTTFLAAEDPFWTLVMAGKNVAPPVTWNKHIYFIGDDKALNCISIDGSFVWRRNTDGIGNFISISQSGLIFVSTRTGKLQAFSSQGIPIWTFDLDETPLYAPYSSLDGRLFVLTSKTLFCFSQQGVLKWKHTLQSEPVLDITETGNGEIILVLKNGDFIRLSVFGHLNEEKKLVKMVSALSKAPSGYLMACTDGSLFYYKTVLGSESVWQVKTSSPAVSLTYASGKYLAVCKDGSVWFSTIEENEKVWFAQLSFRFSDTNPVIRILKDEIHITALGFGACLLSNGTIKWQASIPEISTRSVITENGMLIGTSGKIINAYRMEVKFLRTSEHAEILDDSYNIIDNTPLTIPPVFDSAGSKSLFSEINKAIKTGTLAENEPVYAASLVGILQNKWKTQFGQNFTVTERAEAASLLGSLGSYEYRQYLIDEGYKTNNQTLTVGIVKGLRLIAYDPDGKTLEYLSHVITKTPYNDSETMKAVCDCLQQLSSFGDYTTSTRTISALFSIINGKFSSNIKSYARQKIENIVQ